MNKLISDTYVCIINDTKTKNRLRIPMIIAGAYNSGGEDYFVIDAQAINLGICEFETEEASIKYINEITSQLKYNESKVAVLWITDNDPLGHSSMRWKDIGGYVVGVYKSLLEPKFKRYYGKTRIIPSEYSILGVERYTV